MVYRAVMTSVRAVERQKFHPRQMCTKRAPAYRSICGGKKFWVEVGGYQDMVVRALALHGLAM